MSRTPQIEIKQQDELNEKEWLWLERRLEVAPGSTETLYESCFCTNQPRELEILIRPFVTGTDLQSKITKIRRDFSRLPFDGPVCGEKVQDD